MHVSVAGIDLIRRRLVERKEKREVNFKCKNCRNVTTKTKTLFWLSLSRFVLLLGCVYSLVWLCAKARGKFTNTASDFGDVWFILLTNVCAHAWANNLIGGWRSFWGENYNFKTKLWRFSDKHFVVRRDQEILDKFGLLSERVTYTCKFLQKI